MCLGHWDPCEGGTCSGEEPKTRVWCMLEVLLYCFEVSFMMRKCEKMASRMCSVFLNN